MYNVRFDEFWPSHIKRNENKFGGYHLLQVNGQTGTVNTYILNILL